MSFWTDETKAKAVELYLSHEPTPETSTEAIRAVAEELGQSPNGVRMIIIASGKYVKKSADAPASSSAKKASAGEGSKRVSKEDSIAALKKAIEDAGKEVDEEILSKLTGKAAVYFTSLLK